MIITTDNKYRNLVYGYELTEKEKKQFDSLGAVPAGFQKKFPWGRSCRFPKKAGISRSRPINPGQQLGQQQSYFNS